MACREFDFFDLGRWPLDCFDQQNFINQLESELNALNQFIDLNSNQVVVLEQTTEPTQGQWEAAWVAQVGGSLPIPATAILLWYNTTLSDFGGIYGTVTGFPTVYRRISQFTPGTVVEVQQQYDRTARSSVLSLTSNSSLLPSISFVTYVPTTVILTFGFTSTSGGSNAGADFAINNVKYGTQYAQVAPNGGVIENFVTNARYNLRGFVPNLSAGAYTVRPMIGVAGAPAAPASVGWGGVSAVTFFTAEVIID